eukprot:TRINITY_DN181_c0_g1_i5.p1 TRINITY_DN181_c0_g1~~TRINITY_DN181_c0_g1_i5.p1  ORF type:complete len:365 (-),score=92.78 TRINITY_DN181_c0_g1_i5:34-1128(-)
MFRLKTLPQALRQCTYEVSEFIHADPNNFQFFINANTATSTIFKSIVWRPGDRVVIFDVDYEATVHACNWLRKYYAIEVIELPIDLPLTREEIVSSVEENLKKILQTGPLPRLANFCHVTSRTGFIFPAKELTALFHKYKIPVCIDGAQAPGHIPINVNDIGAEFYIGTLHKWCFTPQGTAFLVVRPHAQCGLTPLTVPLRYGGGFVAEFGAGAAHIDYAHFLTITQSFEFVRQVCGGWERVMEYCSETAKQAVQILEQEWHTTVFQGDPKLYGRLPIVPLPNGIFVKASVIKQIMAYLALCQNITAFLVCIKIKGVPTVCVRLSCQVWTEPNEVRQLAQVVLDLGGAYNTGKVATQMASDLLL